ncbi:cytidylyltransferase domain-containing protein [Dethiothermospora halolimnae]|uniref:cytidylyltransferase domain-containing protein n=1 Tax=Dethiothermospora halolimnae TaxID=3114390 RepID=UPI003CCBEF5B
MKKIVCIIQARMGSTRLPGKVIKKLSGKTVLSHVIDRVKQSKLIHDIVIATTENKKDSVIVEEAKKKHVKYLRGSEKDVLSRYYYAAKENNGDIVVRITSDCPLIDPLIIDKIIKKYKENEYNIITNGGNDLVERTYPRGLDVEVFSFDILKKAYLKAHKSYQREHVTPYMYENSKNIYYFKNDIDYSKYRWTLDTKEDLQLIKNIYNNFYKGTHNFYFKDILKYIEENPQLSYINEHVNQKSLEKEVSNEGAKKS